MKLTIWCSAWFEYELLITAVKIVDGNKQMIALHAVAMLIQASILFLNVKYFK